MQFIGRNKELNALEESYQAPGCSFIPIYGRRRVGKSELIKHFISNKLSLYFLEKQEPARLQIKESLRNGAQIFQQPLLTHSSADDWQTAISLNVEYIPVNDKLILAAL